MAKAANQLLLMPTFMIEALTELDILNAKKELQKQLLQSHMERAMGIEPTSRAWEARILPMNYARISN